MTNNMLTSTESFAKVVYSQLTKTPERIFFLIIKVQSSFSCCAHKEHIEYTSKTRRCIYIQNADMHTDIHTKCRHAYRKVQCCIWCQHVDLRDDVLRVAKLKHGHLRHAVFTSPQPWSYVQSLILQPHWPLTLGLGIRTNIH